METKGRRDGCQKITTEQLLKAKNLIYIEPNLCCTDDDSYFEPLSSLSSECLVHFIRLMEDYTVAGEENHHKKVTYRL